MDITDDLPDVRSAIADQRKGRKMTLDELAALSGVSKSMLSQIESGKANPTVVTAWKIAKGLGIGLAELLGEDRSRKFELTRRENTVTLETEGHGVHIRVLSPLSMADDLEFYSLELAAGAALISEAHVTGTEEYLTIVQGRLSVAAGDKEASLERGDFLVYHADIPHEIRNDTNDKAQAQLVVRYR